MKSSSANPWEINQVKLMQSHSPRNEAMMDELMQLQILNRSERP